MRAALSAVEAPRAAPRPVEDRRLDRVLRPVEANSAPAGDGGYRFWACARGSQGRARTTAVWGLWLDQAVVFAADTESIADGDPRVFPASVLQLEEDGTVRVVDGSAERVDDPALLVRFASECKAKYGFEPDPDDPDTPVYAVRPESSGSEQSDRA
jgi:hypothetical protein